MQEDFNRYQKISDDIYSSGPLQVKFNVVLTKVGKDKKPVSYHQETEYGPSYARQCNIKRSFDFFLSFEHTRPEISKYDKEVIKFRYGDIPSLRLSLRKVYTWFFGEDAVFATSKGQLIRLTAPKEELQCGGGLIGFEPVVYVNPNGVPSPGCKLYINHVQNYIVLSMYGLNYIRAFIEEVNMYQSAQLMLNYIQRPPLGTNSYSVQSYDNKPVAREPEEVDTSAVKGRQIPSSSGKRFKSFFDKIDNL